MKTRKKWLRKTTAICTAALLGTAAIPSTAFAADSYASIEKDAWAKKVTEMASSYATSIEESQSDTISDHRHMQMDTNGFGMNSYHTVFVNVTITAVRLKMKMRLT